jgi:hypothetical protein
MASPEFRVLTAVNEYGVPRIHVVNEYGVPGIRPRNSGVPRIRGRDRGIMTAGNEYGVPRVRVPYHWKVIQA